MGGVMYREGRVLITSHLHMVELGPTNYHFPVEITSQHGLLWGWSNRIQTIAYGWKKKRKGVPWAIDMRFMIWENHSGSACSKRASTRPRVENWMKFSNQGCLLCCKTLSLDDGYESVYKVLLVPLVFWIIRKVRYSTCTQKSVS